MGVKRWSLATRDELFSPHEQLALAGFLAGYSGLTRDAYTLETASCPCSLGLEDHGERVD
jgi:hypothetical protein